MILLLCMSNISDEIWIELYQAAGRLRELAPWQWMYDTDLFGVEDPQTGLQGYCCILGMAGEMFGMALYRGKRGLASYEQLQETNVDEPIGWASSAFGQDCLMISFGPRGDLEPEDLQRIKRLGLKFRGKTHWPDFKDYSPGLMPWNIEDESQAQFLALAIEQAIGVAERCKVDQDLLDHVEDSASCILMRQQHSDGHWRDNWLPLEGQNLENIQPLEANQLYLRSNLSIIPRKDMVWLADIFYFPSPIQENPDTRPYFPQVFLLVDLDTQRVIGHELFSPNSIHEQLQETFVKSIKELNMLPSILVVPSIEIMELLVPLAKEANIQLELDEGNVLLSEVKLSLFGSMSL